MPTVSPNIAPGPTNDTAAVPTVGSPVRASAAGPEPSHDTTIVTTIGPTDTNVTNLGTDFEGITLDYDSEFVTYLSPRRTTHMDVTNRLKTSTSYGF